MPVTLSPKGGIDVPVRSLTGDLFPASLPEIFRDIHNYLYANSNIPRAERLGAELIRILFCKIYDETKNRDCSEFILRAGENERKIGDRIRRLFEKVKAVHNNVFDPSEKIHLDDRSIAYVIEKLGNYVLTETQRDVVNEAFQAFWGPRLRGEKGQFFTPRNVVRMCVAMLDPGPKERVIDPACGSGGFLVEVLWHLGKGVDTPNIWGIDKEIDLTKICKAYMGIVGGGHENIYCADSLDPDSWYQDMKTRIGNSSFDVVVTNPPFGARIFIGSKAILERYELGHKWIKENSGKWKRSGDICKQVPQVLFIERCLQLLKPGGRMAIVLPDGIFGNPSDRYIWQFITEKANISAVVSLPPETFLPSTHTKTSVLFLEKHKGQVKNDRIFMAIADKVGHDKNGKIAFKIDGKGNHIVDGSGSKIVDDDLPTIVSNYKRVMSARPVYPISSLGFMVEFSEIHDFIYIPGYYDPEVKQQLRNMKESGMYKLTTIKELADKGIISIKRGHEVGSMYYGVGDIPFVRTSDIVNWEIKIDPVKCIPLEIYKRFTKRQDIKEGDILIITDGTFLIGRTAIVTSLDKRLVIQSHIRRIRCLRHDELHPYLLLYLLNTKVVQKQIQEKTFVQATISTLGERFLEIVLPIPSDSALVDKVVREVSDIIAMKVKARMKMDRILQNGEAA